MNKRIRKKQLKRALNGLLAVCDAYEAMWERMFREAKQDLVDAYISANATSTSLKLAL